MNTSTTTTASITSPMRPTSDPLKLLMEDIEKTQTLSGKCAKLQAYLHSFKVDMSKIKDLDVPICKQILKHAIKTLEVEHDKVLGMIKDILNQTGITNVKVLPEEMKRVFQNPILAPTNMLQGPQLLIQMQQRLGQHGSPTQTQQGVWQQGSLPARMQQGLGQQSGSQIQMPNIIPFHPQRMTAIPSRQAQQTQMQNHE